MVIKMKFDMLKYYTLFNDFNISIMYSGPIWMNNMESIAETVKRTLEDDDLSFSSSQSIFSIFTEQMNNILMYSAEKEQFYSADNECLNISKGIFILGQKDHSYFLQSGNMIKNTSIDRLKSNIDYLNTLDKVQLRTYYKEKIKSENPNPESKGAGLGLIEIARRANSKIEYKFTPIDENISFFTIFVTV